MAEVTLVIKADNSQYINKMKEAQNASQRLHETSVAGGKREKGILEEIDSTLARLEKSKRKAFTFEDIERYNKRIAEAKQHLQEYEQAGLKVEKQTDSMIKTAGKWLASLGLITVVLNELKKAFTDTILGMNLLTAAQQVWTQMTYNVVTANNTLNTSLVQSLAIGKQINELRKKERVDLVDIAKLQTQYNQLYFAASDRRRSDTERIQLLDQALIVHNLAVDKEIENLREQQIINTQQLAIRPKSNKLLNEEARLTVAIEKAEASRWSEVKRIEALRTGMIQERIDNEVKAIEEIKKEKIKSAEEERKLEEKREMEGQKHAIDLIKRRDDQREDERKKRTEDIEEEVTYWEILQVQTENAQEVIGDILDEAARRNKERRDKEADEERKLKDKIIQFKIDAFNESAILAQNTAALLSVISTNQMNKELANLDRKTQGLLDIAALNGLTKQEEVFIHEEAEREKLEIEKKYRRQQQSLAIAQAMVDSAAAIIKIWREYAWNPILAAILIGIATAALGVQIAIIKKQKFAKGGWTGDGGDRDETGERVAGVVHEKEFVTKRGPASKYREVLEAINRDDKKAIYNSFTKIEPELLGNTTNVTVENSGPNNRLDRINNQLSQLNRNLSPKRQVREDVMTDGNTTIIRRGANVRTIRR